MTHSLRIDLLHRMIGNNMNSLTRVMVAAAVSAAGMCADGPGRIESHQIARDFDLTADPNAAAWSGVRGVFADHGPKGEPVAGHRTEIRSRWTPDNLYVLFICPYQTLHL